MNYVERQNTDTASQTNADYLIVANFLPVETGRKANPTMLAHFLDSAGKQVVTASEPGRSIARISLKYRTRALERQSREQLADALSPNTRVFFYLSGLVTRNIKQKRMIDWAAEHLRRVQMVRFLARSCPELHIVNDLRNPFSMQAVMGALLWGQCLFSRKARFHVTNVSPKKLAKATLRHTETKDLPVNAFDTLLRLANSKEQGDSTVLKPRRVLMMVESHRDASDAIKNDVNMQVRHASSIGNVGRYAIRNLGQDAHIPVACETKRATANAFDSATGMSEFMKHFRAHPMVERNASAQEQSDDRKYVEWYIHAQVTQRARNSLPVPIEALMTNLGDHRTTKNALIPDSWKQLAGKHVYVDHSSKTQFDQAMLALDIIFSLAPRVESLEFVPDDLIKNFARPIGDEPGALSQMELFTAIHTHLELPAEAAQDPIWRSDLIRDWFKNVVCRWAPVMRVFSTAVDDPLAPTLPSHPPKAEIFGIFEGMSGLARNAHMHANALNDLGIPTSFRSGQNPFFMSAPIKLDREIPLKRSFYLHNVNAHDTPRQLTSAQGNAGPNPFHVGFFLWEFDKLPNTHLHAGDLLDEVWVPSEFVRQAYQPNYDVEVINVGKAIDLPDQVENSDTPLPYSPDKFTFTTCFDFGSSVERKNPLAAVEAFLDAFPNDRDVQIVVKTTEPKAPHINDPNGQMDQIAKLAAKDSRIRIMYENLSFPDYLRLIAESDCILSTHRSEGFGYLPAFALWYERPVIATDYSGNTDFCNSDTAFPVPYKLKDVRRGEFVTCFEGARWAEIDRQALVKTMQQVRSDREVSANRASAGRALVHRLYEPSSLQKRYQDRLRLAGVID